MKRTVLILLIITTLYGRPTDALPEDTTFIKIHIICDENDDKCDQLDEATVKKLKAMSKLKTFKSWMRIFSSDKGENFLNKFDADRKKVITYIICHSADAERLNNNQYGIEIFYNKHSYEGEE